MNFRKIIMLIYWLMILFFIAVLIIGNLYTLPRFLIIIFVIIFAPLIILSVFIWIIFIAMIGTPKNEFLTNFSIKYYSNEIKCEQIDKYSYKIYLKNGDYKTYKSQNYFILNMRGWLFKKTHIRDIILMNYHLNFFNKNKFLYRKLFSKKYFENENMSISFELLNGRHKIMPMIKKGIEKRSIFTVFKYLFPCSLISRKNIKQITKKYYYWDLSSFYI